jgi:hypothetical protein
VNKEQYKESIGVPRDSIIIISVSMPEIINNK